MHRVLVLGAGKIGALISGLLGETRDYEVRLADLDGKAVERVVKSHALKNVHGHELDASNPDALRAHLDVHPCDAIVSGLPYYCNPAVGEVARERNLHYFDLTEDVAVTDQIRKMSEGASTAFVPQCGLAPGFISIAAHELISHFDKLDTVQLRVGALPQNPNNALKYSLTWSTDGVINEYGNLCRAVVNGQEVDVLPLEGREDIRIDGMSYEAFNTSGGLGSLAETYAGKARNIDYKTMRYPGHCAQIRLLMNDLKLNEDRATLKRIFENAIPRTIQDVVIIYTSVTGMQNNVLAEESYVNKVYPQMIAGKLWSAIQVTTASGVCSVLDLVMSDPDDYKGFVRQEQFGLKDILDNRFGHHYAPGGNNSVSARAVATGKTGHTNQVEKS